MYAGLMAGASPPTAGQHAGKSPFQPNFIHQLAASSGSAGGGGGSGGGGNSPGIRSGLPYPSPGTAYPGFYHSNHPLMMAAGMDQQQHQQHMGESAAYGRVKAENGLEGSLPIVDDDDDDLAGEGGGGDEDEDDDEDLDGGSNQDDDDDDDENGDGEDGGSSFGEADGGTRKRRKGGNSKAQAGSNKRAKPQLQRTQSGRHEASPAPAKKVNKAKGKPAPTVPAPDARDDSTEADAKSKTTRGSKACTVCR